jgi:hypothetical protein
MFELKISLSFVGSTKAFFFFCCLVEASQQDCVFDVTPFSLEKLKCIFGKDERELEKSKGIDNCYSCVGNPLNFLISPLLLLIRQVPILACFLITFHHVLHREREAFALSMVEYAKRNTSTLHESIPFHLRMIECMLEETCNFFHQKVERYCFS